MTQPTKADGARALSIEENEVAAVADSPGGLIVITTDDVRYIVVDKDDPQYDERTGGVLFLVPPKLPYHGTFPVYRQPEVPTDGTSEAVDPDTLVPAGSQKELLEWVGADIDRATAALEAEQAKEKPRPTVVDVLGKRMAAIAEAAAAGAPPLP